MLLEKHPGVAKNLSDKVALIDCSYSITQVWPGAWHCCRVTAVM